MIRLPVVSGSDVVKALKRVGFEVRRRESSHIVLSRRDPYSLVVVPDHKSVSPGTLKAILNEAGLTKEEFVRLLKK